MQYFDIINKDMTSLINNKFLKYIKLFFFTFLFVNVFIFESYSGWLLNDGKYQYLDEATNSIVTNKWVQNEAGYYYLGSDGFMITGWHQFDDGWRYFSTQGLMQKGWLELDNKKYYLKTNGVMVTGWIYIEEDSAGFWYYFGSDGSMKKGWLNLNNDWYYLNDGSAFRNTWAKINNKWYHFNNVCSIDKGWYKQDEKYYYLDTNTGEMKLGWVTDVNGNSYFLDRTTGVLVVNTTIAIDGVLYSFNENGQAHRAQSGNVSQASNIPNNSTQISGTTSGYFYNNGVITSNIDSLTAITSDNIGSNTNTNNAVTNVVKGQVEEGRIPRSEVIALSESKAAVTGNVNQSTLNISTPQLDSFGNLIEGSTTGPK